MIMMREEAPQGSQLWGWGVAALAVLAGGLAGQGLSAPAAGLPLGWPMGGVALALALRGEGAVWPGTWAGAAAAYVLAGLPPLPAAVLAAVLAGQASLGAALAGRALPRGNPLQGVRGLFILAGLGSLAGLLTPSVGILLGLLGVELPWLAGLSGWALAWMGGSAAVVLVTPPVLAWTAPPDGSLDRRRWVEAACLLGGLTLVSLLVFMGGLSAESERPFPYLALPFLAWAGLRFNLRATTAASGLVAALAIWGAAHGRGAFHTSSPPWSLFLLLMFLLVAGLMSLTLAALMAERNRADAALRAASEELEGRIRDRTAELAQTNLRLQADNEAHARMEQALQARTRQLVAVRAIGAEVTRELSLDAVLDLIVRRVTELTGGDAGLLRLWDPLGQILVTRAAHGIRETEGSPDLRLGEGVAGAAAQDRRGLVVNDFRRSSYTTPALLATSTHQAVMAEPLLYREKLVGVIAVTREAAGVPFTEADRQPLTLLADQAAIAIENARLYAELQDSFDRLQDAQGEMVRSEKLRALGQMAAGIAHDLNNVLGAILGQIDLLQRRPMEPEIGGALATIQTAASDGAHVVRRVQEFARQQVAVPLVACDLAAIAGEALELTRHRWRDEAQRQGAAIEVRREVAGPAPVLGHPAELREAFVNLILNAVDAMPDGGRLTLRVGAAAGGQVEARVCDTGVGMDEQTREQAFEPFFTTKGGRGSGLGLSIVYGIMERMGGQVAVESTPGQGTTIRLLLRAADAGGPAPPAEPPGARGAACRILLVEDEGSVRRSTAALLRNAGHTVTEAEGGAEAIRLLGDARAYDLLVSDLGMPEVTGWDVARAARAARPELPILLVTGWGEQADAQPGTAGLADRIAGKPIRVGELLRIIAELRREPERPEPA